MAGPAGIWRHASYCVQNRGAFAWEQYPTLWRFPGPGKGLVMPRTTLCRSLQQGAGKQRATPVATTDCVATLRACHPNSSAQYGSRSCQASRAV